MSQNNIYELIKRAQQVWNHAYAPYSQFAVGACVMTPQGNYYSGCNVENAVYNLGFCAETAAIAQMVGAGEQHIETIAIFAQSEQLISPCGACRQRLFEFANPQTLVYLCNQQHQQSYHLKQLLPYAFGRHHLN